jgi:GxxExxY protein
MNSPWHTNSLCGKSHSSAKKPLALTYKAIHLDCGFRLDFLVADSFVVEVKAIDALLPIHQARPGRKLRGLQNI